MSLQLFLWAQRARRKYQSQPHQNITLLMFRCREIICVTVEHILYLHLFTQWQLLLESHYATYCMTINVIMFISFHFGCNRSLERVAAPAPGKSKY